MDKNDTITPQNENRDKNRLTAIVSILIAAALLVADLYVMVNLPGMIPLIAVITVGLLGGVYVFVNAILREINRSKEETKEQYENIFKSEKASYILLKKAFEQLEELEGKSGSNHTSEDIITAQKAIAKVTISRNRENADALLNSNDKMLEKIFDFEEKLGSSHSELLDRQRSVIDDSMRELQESLKSEFAKAISDLRQMQLTAPAAAPEFTAQPKNTVIPEEPLPEEPLFSEDLTLPEEPLFSEDLTLPEEPLLGEEIPLVEEEPLTDAFSLPEEPLFSEDLTLPEEPLLGEEIPLVEEEPLTDAFSLTEEPLSSEEPLLGEEIPLVGEEPLGGQAEESLLDGLDMGLGLDFGLDLGVDIEEAAAEDEPLVEDEPSAEAEPIPEPAPEPIPEPVPEPESAPAPKPAPAAPMPDLSDPHKMMTPDEIAALLANM